jgi:hypothetical protein
MPPPSPWPSTLLTPPAMAARLATPLAKLGLLLRTCIWPLAPCWLGCLRRVLAWLHFFPVHTGPAGGRGPAERRGPGRATGQGNEQIVTCSSPTRTSVADVTTGSTRSTVLQKRGKSRAGEACAVKGPMRWPKALDKWVRLRPPLPGLRRTEGQRRHASCAVRRLCSTTGSGTSSAATTRSTWCSPPCRHHATLATTHTAHRPTTRTGAPLPIVSPTPPAGSHSAIPKRTGCLSRRDYLDRIPTDSPMGRCTIRGHHRQLWEGMLHPAGPRTDRGEPRPRG